MKPLLESRDDFVNRLVQVNGDELLALVVHLNKSLGVTVGHPLENFGRQRLNQALLHDETGTLIALFRNFVPQFRESALSCLKIELFRGRCVTAILDLQAAGEAIFDGREIGLYHVDYFWSQGSLPKVNPVEQTFLAAQRGFDLNNLLHAQARHCDLGRYL